MTINITRPSIQCVSLKDDIRQAHGLLVEVFGQRHKFSPVLLLLGALWLAVNRLCPAVQTRAPSDAGAANELATANSHIAELMPECAAAVRRVGYGGDLSRILPNVARSDRRKPG